MYPGLKFSFETVDGDRLGKLAVPYPQLARWLNFLTSPHYGVQIVYTEQDSERVTIYFDASEGIYHYLSDRLAIESHQSQADAVPLVLAS